MKGIHIIHVSSYYPPHLGGQENAAQSLAMQLAQAGHQVHVLTSTEGGGSKGISSECGVTVGRQRGLVFGHAPVMPWFPVALFCTATSDSVVHIHVGQAFTPEMVWLVSKLRHFKYIAQLHIDFEPSGPAGVLLPLYKQLVLRRVLQSADAVIALNEKTLQTVQHVYGYTGRALVMNNGIDNTYFSVDRPPFRSQPPTTLQLLFVGRFSKQKNIIALLHALRLAKKHIHLHIVGSGEDEELIRHTIIEYGLTNVTMHGQLDREQVKNLYTTCDALIMPSLYEAQPLVLLEAMAARIPVIGTNVIGVVDHIKDAGIIVEPTPEGLAQGIRLYFERYNLLPGMVQHGFEMAQKFRWPETLQQYEALYHEVSAS
jgi:glycosyltransferase involved in cell wall biosynthesis